MAPREDPRQVIRWLGAVYDVRLSMCAWITSAWLAVGILARVGIPSINPTLEFTPRPLETLGAIGLCLPAALQASFLQDHAFWLVGVSPQSASKLRLAWLSAVQVAGAIPATLWILMLPIDVPRINASALWFLVSGITILSVIIVGRDFAIILPAAFMALFSFGSLIPYGINVIYNVGLTRELIICAAVTFISSAGWFARNGDKRAQGQR